MAVSGWAGSCDGAASASSDTVEVAAACSVLLSTTASPVSGAALGSGVVRPLSPISLVSGNCCCWLEECGAWLGGGAWLLAGAELAGGAGPG